MLFVVLLILLVLILSGSVGASYAWPDQRGLVIIVAVILLLVLLGGGFVGYHHVYVP